MKNRFGLSNKSVCVNFFGEIGFWRELPKVDTIHNYANYIVLRKDPKDMPLVKDEPKKLDSKMNIRIMVD